MTYQDVGSLFADLHATLLDGGQHRVAGNGAVTVGETAYRHVVRDFQPHALGSVHDADGRVVVDGKEAVRAVVALQHFRRYGLSIGTVVADACQRLVKCQPMLQQGILIAVKAVL